MLCAEKIDQSIKKYKINKNGKKMLIVTETTEFVQKNNRYIMANPKNTKK